MPSRRQLALLLLLAVAQAGSGVARGVEPGGARPLRKAKLRRARLRAHLEEPRVRPDSAYHQELDVARDLARAAGRLTLQLRGKVAAEKKDGGEVVTEADRRSSALIVAELQRQFPNDLVVTEESKENWDKVAQARRIWFVDPIDATKEYVGGTDGFSVQIGLVEKTAEHPTGKAVLGVVYQPTADRLYFAAPGYGARVQEEGGEEVQLHVSETAHPSQLRLIVSNSNRSKATDQFKQALGITEEEPLGSAGLKLGMIARGDMDLTFKTTRKVKAWDYAAPQAILEAAGGTFTTLEGQPIRYDQIHNTGGLLATNGASHQAVLQLLAPLYQQIKLKQQHEDAAKARAPAARPTAIVRPGFPRQ